MTPAKDLEQRYEDEKLSPQSAAQLASARPPSRLLQRPISRQDMIEEGKRRVLRKKEAYKRQQALLAPLQEDDLPEEPLPETGELRHERSSMP
jgi:hypothetical protein